MARASTELEILVAKIQAELAPDAEVQHNIRLLGRESQTQRQIDVLVKQRIGQYEMNIVIDCKDYAKPVDVKGVEEFQGLVKDVGAHKGVLVCPRGFTEAARTRATGFGMDLYSPVDTDPHKWQARVQAPVICDFRSASISFGVSCSAPLPFMMPRDFLTRTVAAKEDGTKLGNPVERSLLRWNKGKFPIEPGEHQDIHIFDDEIVYVDNGYGMQIPVSLTASLHVEQQLFFGHLPVKKISGFKDELRGGIVTNSFTIGLLDPNIVMNDWEKISSPDQIEGPVVLTLQGLVAWNINT